MLRAVAGFYAPQRWDGMRPLPPERAAWEIVLGPKQADFYLAIPAEWEPVIQKQLAVVWPRARIEAAADPLPAVVKYLKPGKLVEATTSLTGRIAMKNHYMFGFKSRAAEVLPNLLECTRMLKEGEQAVVQLLLTPAPPDWWHQAAESYQDFRARGKMPARIRLDPQTITQYAAEFVAGAVLEVVNITTELIAGGPSDYTMKGPSRAGMMQERPIGGSVSDKLKQDAIATTIRVGVQTHTEQAGRAVLRAIEYAFRTMDGDNGLVMEATAGREGWAPIMARAPGWESWLNRDYMSLQEVAAMVNLPTGEMQAEYGLEGMAHTETPNLPAPIRTPGLLLGAASWKGKPFNVYLPTDNDDETCLPRVIIGPMGCGKTRGYGANLAVEAVLAGYYAVIIDPAAGEIGDEAEAALGPDRVHRLRFGDMNRLIAPDWREVWHADDPARGRNRLAQQLIAFFDSATDEAGPQTARYLRAAAKAVPTGRLSEVVQLMTENTYLQALLPTMREQERAVWSTFQNLSDARRAQIAAPVLNRLDVVLGDDWLAASMEAEEGLDLVALLDDGKPKCIVLDMPKSDLGPEVVDVLAALVATKLDLAMVTRKSRTPTFVIWDEPHQYLRSAKTWRSVAVESRKWRFAYCWMFHSWEQLPADLAEIIRSAGPHYHLYRASPRTFQALKLEIAPWTAEEAVRIPRFHALNIIQAGGQTVPPFLAKMALPPSKRLKGGKPLGGSAAEPAQE